MNRGSSFFIPAGAQEFWVPTWAPRGRITPRSFANLENWWDADDDSTITIATAVNAWTDKVGGLNWSQGTAGLQPVRATGVAALNSRSVIQFDGVDDQLDTPASFNSNISVETIFLVCKNPGTGAGVRLSIQSSTLWDYALAVAGANALDWYVGNTAEGDGSLELIPISLTEYQIIVLRRSIADNEIKAWVGGGASADSATYTTTGAGTVSLSMGAGGGGAPHDFELAEMFRYGRKLSFAEIDSICLKYLVPKWAGEPSWSKMAA